MRLWVFLALLATFDPLRHRAVQDELVTTHYLNQITNEEAVLVRVMVGPTAWRYQIRIGHRYCSDSYHDITAFAWSPDGQHFYFTVHEDIDNYQVVRDGVPDYRSFDAVIQIQWSDSSKHLAYGGIAGINTDYPRVMIILDGVPVRAFSDLRDFYFEKNDELVANGSEVEY